MIKIKKNNNKKRKTSFNSCDREWLILWGKQQKCRQCDLIPKGSENPQQARYQEMNTCIAAKVTGHQKVEMRVANYHRKP